MPGQAATAFVHGKPGLSLSGSGAYNPIEQGKPRASSIERITVPKGGLSVPRSAANGQPLRALDHANTISARPGAIRISASLGEVRLNFHKVTHGLARGTAASPGLTRNAANKDTIWTTHQAGTTTSAVAGSSQGNDASTGNSNSAASTNATTTPTSIAATTAPANSGSGGGGDGGDKGNGKANGNGGNDNNHNNGNGHSHGHGH